MQNDELARRLIEYLGEGDDASAFNLAEEIATDRESATRTLLQLASLVVNANASDRSDPTT